MKAIVFISSILSAALTSYIIAFFKTGLTQSGLGTAFFIVGAIWFCVGAGLLSANVRRNMHDSIDKKAGYSARQMKQHYRTEDVGNTSFYILDDKAGDKNYTTNNIYYGSFIAITGLAFIVAGIYLSS